MRRLLSLREATGESRGKETGDHLGRARFDNADNEPPSFGAAGDELPTISHFNRDIAALSRNGRCPLSPDLHGLPVDVFTP